MANLVCPVCSGKVPRTMVLAQSDGFACPRCGKTLELSGAGRLLASIAGLGGAWLAFDFARAHRWGQALQLDWLVRLACAFLAFGIVSSVFLLFSSELVVKQDARIKAPSAEPTHGPAQAVHH